MTEMTTKELMRIMDAVNEDLLDEDEKAALGHIRKTMRRLYQEAVKRGNS